MNSSEPGSRTDTTASDEEARALQWLTGRVATAAALGVLAIGLTAGVGVLTGATRLASWVPDAATTRINTVVCLILLGIAILLQGWSRSRAASLTARLLGLVVTAIAAATILEWLTGVDLGIDQAIVGDRLSQGLAHPGRFAMATAVGLVAAGPGVVLAGRRIGRFGIAEMVALVCGAVGGMAALGYLFGAQALLSIGSETAISLPTAIALLLLAAALVAANPDHVIVRRLADPGAAGAVLRRVLPAAILVVPAGAWVRLLGERAGLYDEAVGVSIMVVFEISVLMIVGAWATARMSSIERRRHQVERDLVRLGVAASTPLVETAAVGLAVLDRDLRVLYRNPALESLVGSAGVPEIGRRIDVAMPAFAREGRRALERVIASGESVRDLEVTGRTAPAGRTATFLLSADAIRDEAGGIVGANLSVVEITARKRREDALTELAEARRQALTIDQSIPYGTWIAGPDGSMRLLSESFLSMVGHTMAEARDDGWLGFLAPEVAEKARADWSAAVASGGAWDAELSFIAADGRRRTILSRGFPVRDEAGTITSWAGINLDITDRTEAAEFREAFTNILSHELGTPVTSISAASTLLARPGLDPERQAGLLADIAHESERLRRLVEDLVVLARVERGTLTIPGEPVALPHVLAHACEQERRRWPDRTFELSAAADLPVALAEETVVEQITRSLLDNAAKFSGVRATIELVADAVDGCPRVRVLDRGPGLDPAEVPRLFEVFYRSRRTSGVAGSGIGLFVAQRLVESVGGEIWAKSRDDGPGAEFGFRLQAMPEEQG